jgi:hypothetical protein
MDAAVRVLVHVRGAREAGTERLPAPSYYAKPRISEYPAWAVLSEVLREKGVEIYFYEKIVKQICTPLPFPFASNGRNYQPGYSPRQNEAFLLLTQDNEIDSSHAKS